MSFTNTKDRFFEAYDTFSKWLSQRSKPVRKAVYSVFGALLKLVYLLPGSSVRQTAVALTAHTGHRSPRRLYWEYVRQFLMGFDRAERIRHGFGAEIDDTLSIPDRGRMEKLLEKGGFILVLPHAHSAIPMARCLNRIHPLLSIVRVSKNKNRAAAQYELYEKIGCAFVDVRSADPATVARAILKALKQGHIIAAMVDRIDEPPSDTVNAARDMAAVTAFGETVGVQTWPARYAQRAGVPIVPGTVLQTDDEMQLVLGEAVTPTAEIASTTQAWMRELEQLLREYPQEWIFWLDKHWSRVLRRNPPARN